MFTSLIDKGAAIITNMAYDWLINCGVFTSKELLRLSKKKMKNSAIYVDGFIS